MVISGDCAHVWAGKCGDEMMDVRCGRRDTPAIPIDVRSRRVALVLMGVVAPLALSGCAGPLPLSVAMDPQDEAAYLEYANEADLNGRVAFANWLAAERGISPEEVLRRDAELSDRRNPFDAYSDWQAVSRGAAIYNMSCMRCHGQDARGHGPATLEGYPANDFKSFGNRFAATLHRGAPRKWFRSIRDGSGEIVEYPDGETTAMPPFRDELANEQIWLVITYLQTLNIHAPPHAKETKP
jgi:mono/diheme cytochrome c family protein